MIATGCNLYKWAMTDSNHRPPRCRRDDMQFEVVNSSEVTTPVSDVCPRVCPSDAENANVGPLDSHQDSEREATAGNQSDGLATLAATIASLSAEDRETLSGMLAVPVQNQDTGTDG